ncbi:hypothetical protein P3X46_009178 [Hevea brasiliensis]|uniref:Integrase zinc-binding domain-containing protein n=1 Tax=Hevea brasiliensis TaxID=3981 RepID=A0ABQ9MLH9_HEVBR|nr:hypothetical protein P3X46_009178 [Hevea brasiliensis]
MAAASEQHLTQPLPMEEITFLTIDQEESLPIDIRSTWMSSIFCYLEDGTLLDDPLEVKKKNSGKVLLRPWLKCITPEEGMTILIDIHEGLCGSHEGARTIAKKAFRQGYF